MCSWQFARRLGNDFEIQLRKIDFAGATVWNRTYADGVYNRLDALAVDSSGNLIATGSVSC